MMLNISETERFRGSCPIGSLHESAYGASTSDVIDDVTRLCDVVLASHNFQSRRIRKLGPGSTNHLDASFKAPS